MSQCEARYVCDDGLELRCDFEVGHACAHSSSDPRDVTWEVVTRLTPRVEAPAAAQASDDATLLMAVLRRMAATDDTGLLLRTRLCSVLCEVAEAAGDKEEARAWLQACWEMAKRSAS